ncbi:MAG: S-layer homology domain-containing protein [Candidatus Gracilibacteria bacterium]
MNKFFLSLSILAVFTVSTTTQVLAAESIFSDTPETHPNNVAIRYLVKQGIFKGYSDGTFKPEKILNKAEALKIIIEGAAIKTDDANTASNFKDVASTDWFAKYVTKGKELGIVSGNPDGTFLPGKTVSRAEFLKMVLIANTFKADNWKGKALYPDVPTDAWYNAYMNFAGSSGLLIKDAQGNLLPTKELSRGEVAEILYLLTIMLKGTDVQFLISQSEAEMVQIEVFMNASDIIHAKRSSELAVDFTQQAYKILPSNNVVLGAAKLAKAYDMVITAFIAGVQKDKAMAEDYAKKAIAKADEAIAVYAEITSVANHVKSRANDILEQVKKL